MTARKENQKMFNLIKSHYSLLIGGKFGKLESNDLKFAVKLLEFLEGIRKD